MKRWVFNVIAVVSAFAGIALLAAWRLGHMHPSPILAYGLNTSQSYVVELLGDSLYLESATLPFQPSKSGGLVCGSKNNPLIVLVDGHAILTPRIFNVSFAGFSTGGWHFTIPAGQKAGVGHGRFVQIPYWMLTVLWGICPTAWVIKAWIGRQRFPAGHCVVCGYDLRVSPERCPECGTPTVSSIK